MFKLLLTTTTVMTLAVPAMASKARMAALQNAAHVYDSQSIFDNPARAFMLGDWAVLEMGATSTARMGANTPETATTNGQLQGNPLLNPGTIEFYSPNAEGGFVRSHGDSKWGFYLGRKSSTTTRVRTLMGFAGQENPFELMYGFQAADLKWGASLNYSKSDPKDNVPTPPTSAQLQQSQETLGARLGVMGSNWEAALTFGLGSKATGNDFAGITTASATSEYKGTTGFKASAGYWMETTYLYGSYFQEGVDANGVPGAGPFAGVTSVALEQNQYEIGVIDTIKAEGMDFFYGVSYIGFKSEDKNNNAAVESIFEVEQSQLPFVIGVEADATPWLVLRASARQNLVLGERRPSTGAAMTNGNNTTVALGSGIKFNKFLLDATLAAATTPAFQGSGNISANALFGNASLTYMF